MVFSLWICSKNDVVFAFLHFVLYFSSNLRMIQGWINLHMSEFKTKLGNVDNACTECVLYNMRSYKYKCLEKFVCNLFLMQSAITWKHFGFHENFITVVTEGNRKLKSWLIHCWVYPQWGSFFISASLFGHFGTWITVKVTVQFIKVCAYIFLKLETFFFFFVTLLSSFLWLWIKFSLALTREDVKNN